MVGEVDRPTPQPAQIPRLRIIGAMVAIGLLAAPSAWSGLSSTSHAAKRPTKPILKINARILVAPAEGAITPVKLFFAPSVINVGTVRIVIRNFDPLETHQISINGVLSRWMGPSGGTAMITVTFKRPGIYTAGTIGGINDGPETGGEGVLKVLK